MSDPARLPRMTSDEFIAWAMEQPKGKRYELSHGEIVQMAPERLGHARMKFRIARLLAEAVKAAELPCQVFIDGVAVVVDEDTTYEPDVLLCCSNPLDDDNVKILDPLVVVEVASPSTQALDSGAKLEDYWRIPSLCHYLIVRTKTHVVIHHARDEAGTITTRIIRDGTATLDPPGITVRDIFD
jgi:Uma2 family endonuclease